MAAFHFTATLVILQGLLFSYAMAQSGSGSGSGDDSSSSSMISPTTTQMTSTSTSSVGTPNPGATVTLELQVAISDCSGNLQTLIDELEDDIEQVYKNESFPINTVNVIGACDDESAMFTVTLSFYTGIPSGKTVKGVFETALKEEAISNLKESSTTFTITFAGIEVKYSPKEGQCEAICCNGAGGELTVEPVCTPVEKCEGISKDEKKESGHCPGESIGSCPDTCKDSGSRHSLSSFAVIIPLVLTKTIFC